MNRFKKNRKWQVDNLCPKHGYIPNLIKQSKSTNPTLAAEAVEALAFIKKFNAEYYDNSGLKTENALHNTPELVKDCYNRTNSANRDLYGIKMSAGEGVIIFDHNNSAVLTNISADSTKIDARNKQQNAINALLDLKIKLEEDLIGNTKKGQEK